MARSPADVFTLMVQLGRRPGDGLPEECEGAALLCFTAAHSEAEAVSETVAVLRLADMAPLEVQSYGTLAERNAEGQEISAEDRALMQRALDENAVIVAQIVPYDEDDLDDDDDDDDEADGGPDPAHV
jgi:hypothetical protein